MKHVRTIGKLISFTLILLTAVTNIAAQEAPVAPDEQTTSGLSGKVVDTEGKPVPGFNFAVQSMQVINGFPQPFVVAPHILGELPDDVRQPKVLPLVIVKTEDDGSFKTENIQPGMVQINGIPDAMLDALKNFDPNDPQQLMQREMMMRHHHHRNKTEMQIVSIRLNKITFYSLGDMGPFEGLIFGLKPGNAIEDVKITVKKLLKIRAQIVYADGTPVANTDARLSIGFRGGEFGGGTGRHGTRCSTDAEGYFTEYRDEPGYYTLSVTIKNFSGGAGPFLINKGVHPENIVIKLDGNPVKKKPAGDKKEINQENVLREAVEKAVRANPDQQIVVEVEAFAGGNAPQPIARQPEKIVWIINPANGHAYAQVNCNGWHDAQQKAIKEESHLLSINDEEEQIWVQIMFRNPHFWIGLNDVEEEGVWRWDSGEPVTYTNWAAHEVFGSNEPDAEKDFVAVTHFEGGWQAAGEKSPLWHIARTAIIEKDGMISKVPEPDEETEEE